MEYHIKIVNIKLILHSIIIGRIYTEVTNFANEKLLLNNTIF